MQQEEFMQTVMVYKNKMYRFALSYLPNEEEAQDTVQDVLAKLWESRDTLYEVRNIEAWCMTLIRNKSLDKLKRKSHKMRVHLDGGTPNERLYAHHDSPEHNYQNKELGTMIDKAIKSLPEKQRAAFNLRDVQGYSYIEIAELLEIDMNQVKVNIFRARQALQQLLQNALSDEK